MAHTPGAKHHHAVPNTRSSPRIPDTCMPSPHASPPPAHLSLPCTTMGFPRTGGAPARPAPTQGRVLTHSSTAPITTSHTQCAHTTAHTSHTTSTHDAVSRAPRPSATIGLPAPGGAPTSQAPPPGHVVTHAPTHIDAQHAEQCSPQSFQPRHTHTHRHCTPTTRTYHPSGGAPLTKSPHRAHQVNGAPHVKIGGKLPLHQDSRSERR